MELRRARPGGELAVAEVHVRSWQVAYRGLLPAVYLVGLRPEDRARRYTFALQGPDDPVTVVAVEAGAVRGFASVGPCRDEGPAGAGEVYAIYADPDFFARGVGRALITDARDRLTTRGCREAILWVLAGNQRAMRFYERDGWRPDGGRRLEEVHGITVDEVRYRRILGE
jgi:GNAT superfamily N-acetyltransferase